MWFDSPWSNFLSVCFPFFLHVDQRDQERKQNQSVFNTNLIPLHLFIKMTPCGCHFKSSSNKNQSDLWQSHTHVTSFTNVLLQGNRLSLHHYSIHLSSKSALPWPAFDRMCHITSILSPESVKHHLLSAFTIHIILCRTTALSLSQFAVSPDSVDGRTSCSPGCCSDWWGGERRASVLCVSPVC